MSERPTRKLSCYALLASAPLVCGFVLRRPDIVLLALPFALALCFGLLSSAPPKVSVSVSLGLESARILEGDQVDATLAVKASPGVGRVELAVGGLGEGLSSRNGHCHALVVQGSGFDEQKLPLSAARWGAYTVGPVAWRVLGPGRFVSYEGLEPSPVALRVYPRAERLRHLLPPAHTSLVAGNYTARAAGSGIEFFDIRPFAFGDSYKEVNWHLSSMREELYVNTRHAEQAGELVVLVDTFSERHLEQVIRAAVAIVTAYGGVRDRIGIVSFGGVLGWVEPALGTRQLYRLIDALLMSRAVFSYAWRDALVIPPRALPPGALVIAVSPLEDPRTVATLRDLRARGIDLVAMHVAPEQTDPGPTRADRLSYRLWRLSTRLQRDELQRAGIAIGELGDEGSLAGSLLSIARVRKKGPSRLRVQR